MNESTIALTDPGHPQWKSGHIDSAAQKEYRGYLFMALFWNLFSQPMFWLIYQDQPDLEAWKLLLVGLFPLVGFWLAYITLVKWLRWRRFGALTLQMDPFPGSLGGDLGGRIELPLPYQAGQSVTITVSCVNIVIKRGGKNKSRSERVLWREQLEAAVEPGMKGTRVQFSVAIPSDLPSTREPSDDTITWMVRVHRELAGADLDQTFEVPVLDTDEPGRSRRSGKQTQDSIGGKGVTKDIQVEQTVDGLNIFYPAKRGFAMGLMLMLFGLSFGVVPGFIIANFSGFSGDAFGMIFILMGGFFVLVFGLVGLLLLAFGFYTLFNSLDIVVSEKGIISIRRVLGFQRLRTLDRKDIRQLQYKINAQQGNGARADVHYVLEAVPINGKPVSLGDGIKGKPLARHLMQAIGQALGIEDWAEVTRRKLKGRRQTSGR